MATIGQVRTFEHNTIPLGKAGRSRHRGIILTSPFHVPLRWFAAFDGKEREVLSGPGGPAIRYRTSRRSALRRLERARRVLEASGFEEDTVGPLQDLSEWLRPFPGDSVVELDYGGVARLFTEEELADDESAADVADSLAALQHGDPEEAGGLYTVVAARWARAQALSFAN